MLLLSGLFATHAQAQLNNATGSDPLIPVIEQAESVFASAISAYEVQDYSTAERLFGVSANTFDLHQKTTAALLMRGKSLYMARDYGQARLVLQDFIDKYRTSRYVYEANQIIAFADDALNPAFQNDQVIRLGIALPKTEQATVHTQNIINGIRMAIEEHNSMPYDPTKGPAQKIQLIFRDTQNDANAAREAVRSLAQENVVAIIGPLFSDESVAAAEVAEHERVVMIPPMATDDRVSFNRQFTFQANPSIETRGRLMARFTAYGLRLKEIGILVDSNNSESLRMSRAFTEELELLNAEQAEETDRVEILFNKSIPNPRSWYSLNQIISKDSLAKAKGIYIPINGGNASSLIGGALTSLGRMPFHSANRPRLLGNVEWHDISQKPTAGKFLTTYSNDFFVNPADSSAIEFTEKYKTEIGSDPNRLVFIGYDITRFILAQVSRQTNENRPLVDIIRQTPMYQGYGNRFDFSKGNINQAMFFHKYEEGLMMLMR